MHTVLHADDSPHAIALGVGIAMIVAFLPLVGLQTVIAIGLAALFRANKAVCLPIVWITNPLTLVPVYGGCLALGRVLTPTAGSGAEADVARLAQIKVDLLTTNFWKEVSSLLVALGIELWIGCLVVGVVFGVASYFTARWGVAAYRERRRRRLLRRSLLRSQSQEDKISRRSEVA